MILKGSQRSGGKQLAYHLLKNENEHVNVHEVRGFISEDLKEAFEESHAISKGTQCKQYLFSLSLNPPQQEKVPVSVFEKAVDEIENKLGLKDQPRAIVFHEKEGRRHAHVVWSRIDEENMKAINLPFYKNRLNELAKELYLEHGWDLPKGFSDPLLKDPLNFNQAEWQQAMRTGRDPREIKHVFQEAWRQSDGRKALNSALEEYGFKLARGDRRGFVAVDYTGEIYSLPKWTGIKTKEVKDRLGTPETLPSIEDVKQQFKDTLTPKLEGHIQDLKIEQTEELKLFNVEKRKMALAHKHERNYLKAFQDKRQQQENGKRQARYNKGLKGLIDWATGRKASIKKQNELEAWQALKRDQREFDQLIGSHLDRRQILQLEITSLKKQHLLDREKLAQDIGDALKFEGRKVIIKKQIEKSRELDRDQHTHDFER